MVPFKLADTGASFTTTFDIRVFFYIDKNSDVQPCPVHMEVIKGYRNSRSVYQLVPKSNWAVLELEGSANPRGYGVTPEEALERGPLDFLKIRAKGNAAKRLIESAEQGIIKEIFEDMCSSVPGRFCYYPPFAKKKPVIHYNSELISHYYIISLKSFIDMLSELQYPSYSPTWFTGGEIKAGYITPTQQGNLIGTSRVKAPCWAGVLHPHSTLSIVKDSSLSIKGNENNEHRIKFSDDVEILQDGRAALVYSYNPVEFEITHPQHEPVEGKMKGVIQFVHLSQREP